MEKIRQRMKELEGAVILKQDAELISLEAKLKTAKAAADWTSCVKLSKQIKARRKHLAARPKPESDERLNTLNKLLKVAKESDDFALCVKISQQIRERMQELENHADDDQFLNIKQQLKETKMNNNFEQCVILKAKLHDGP